jgi:hypothetical protein
MGNIHSDAEAMRAVVACEWKGSYREREPAGNCPRGPQKPQKEACLDHLLRQKEPRPCCALNSSVPHSLFKSDADYGMRLLCNPK